MKESDLHEDADHNIKEDEDDIHVYSDDDEDEEYWDDDEDYDEDGNLIQDAPATNSYYDADSNSFVEEKGDINSDYYEKKVVSSGPGYQTVTIVSKGGASNSPLGAFDMLN